MYHWTGSQWNTICTAYTQAGGYIWTCYVGGGTEPWNKYAWNAGDGYYDLSWHGHNN